MAEKWNDDKTQITLDAADYEALKNGQTQKFNDGFAKGKESGKKEIAHSLSGLGIDVENLDSSVSSVKAKLDAVNDPKKLIDLIGKDKINELELVKSLNAKVDQKDQALLKVTNDFDSFKRKTLITNSLKSLANSENDNRKKAINPDAAVAYFQTQYNLDIADGDQVVVKKLDGNQIFNEKGDALGLNDVFELFAKSNTYMFEGSQSGGSGDGPGGGGGSSKGIFEMTDSERVAYKNQIGVEAYKKQYDAEISAGKHLKKK